MCKYCAFEVNETNAKEHKDFFTAGSGITVSTGICAKNRLFSLVSYDSQILFDADIKINYCPMCGRKLTE